MEPYQYFEEVNQGLLKLALGHDRVLDVGCGLGALGEELRGQGCYVVGLDVSEEAVGHARPRLDEAYVCDVTADAGLPFDESERFDLIVFGDVLEHVADPLAVLSRFKRCIRPGGHIVVSLPNVASWPIRLKLFFGSFTYTDSGILDRTHLRFFTLKTARELIRQAGFRIEAATVTPNFTRVFLRFVRGWFVAPGSGPADPKAIVESNPYRFYLRWVFPVETAVARLWKSLFAFQFVFYAVLMADATED